MTSRTRTLRKSALCIAMGLCLSSLAAPTLAQSTTGALAGNAPAGDQIVVTSTDTGATRTVTVNADGSYRLAQLPPGEYTVAVARDGATVGDPIPVAVPLGGTATVDLGSAGDVVNLGGVKVVGNRVVNRVDVRSTESSMNVTREEISRMPVEQSLSSVALLAPGVSASNATFGGLVFGGSSVAENVVYINGLNVTDPYRRQGFSTVPFAFYEEFQVKTGGYSAEFGRSTGGVINSITRSGGNEFHGGAQVTIEPESWHSEARDHFYDDGTPTDIDRTSRDNSEFYKYNVWASGPIVRDRLFFFAMYEKRDSNSEDIDTTQAWKYRSDNDFWGTKLDWQLSDDHLLELLAFSDEAETYTTNYDYDWDTGEFSDDPTGQSWSGSGGDNWSLTYTGHLADNFTVKAMHGVNERSVRGGSPWDADCSIVSLSSAYRSASGIQSAGCHPTNGSINNRMDERTATRLDFEWELGDHLLRFGMDREVMDSESERYYPGDGFSYTANTATPGGLLPNGAAIPDGVTAIVDARRYVTGAPVSTKAEAIYLEDNWSVTDNLLLQLGLRADKFHNTLAGGATFARADYSDMISPRIGFSWDMKGDGTTKLFGNAGRYYIPLTNKLTDYFGGGTTDEHTYYVLNGWTEHTDPVTGNTYLAPDLGPQIGPVNTDGNVPPPSDMRTAVAKNLKQVFQDEFILGFQQAINSAWSYGINATYRKVTRAVEDARITHVEGCPWYSGDWPIINPGETTTLWCPDTNDWVTFDSSKDGYIGLGSGTIMGYKKPRRTYKAIEFQVDRAWDDKWAFNASYTWSKSEGNVEGPVNSDTGYNDTNLVQYYDHPAVNERYGPLFNDHRHQIKLRGSYKINEMFSVGATYSGISGGPISAYGVRWPLDNRSAGGPSEFSGGGSGWLCVANCTGDWDEREFVFSPLGAFGRKPWVHDLSASVTWTYPSDAIDLSARFSVYNLLNRQAATHVHSRYESTPGNQMPYFGQARRWQSPRYMQLVVTYNF